MARRHSLLTASVLCLMLLAATSARCAESAVNLIPEGALGFVVVNRLAETDAKLQKLCQQLDLPIDSVLQLAKSGAGIEKGLDEKGSVMFVMLPPAEGKAEPVTLIYLPVVNYKELLIELKATAAKEGISEIAFAGQPTVIGGAGNYAVLAEEPNRDALKKALGGSKSVPADIQPLQDWLAKNDAGVVITHAGVEMIAKLAGEQAKQFGEVVGGLDIYQQIAKEPGKNVQTVAIAAQIDSQSNVQLLTRVRARPGGDLAKQLGEIKPPLGELLAGLPAGSFALAGGGSLMENTLSGWIDQAVQMMKDSPDIFHLSEKQIAKLAELPKTYPLVSRGVSMSLGGAKSGDPAVNNFSCALTVEDSAKYLANAEKTFSGMKSVLMDVKEIKDSPLKDAAIKKTTVDGADCLEISMAITKELKESIPDGDKYITDIFGSGSKVAVLLAAADSHTVILALSNDRLRAGIRAAKDSKASITGNSTVASTAALFKIQPQWVGYWSPQGTAEFVKNMLAKFAPDVAKDLKIPAVSDSPPIGVALRATAEEVQCQLVVPIGSSKAVSKFTQDMLTGPK
jgi:hypothetical protein